MTVIFYSNVKLPTVCLQLTVVGTAIRNSLGYHL